MSQNESNYSTKVLRTQSECEQLRSFWTDLKPPFNADIDIFLSLVGSSTCIHNPYVVVLYNGLKPIALLAGRVESRPFDYKFGYKSFFRVPCRFLTIGYGCILGTLSETLCHLLLNECTNAFYSDNIDVILFNNLPIHSYLYRYARNKSIYNSWHFLNDFNQHWQISLPTSFDTFLQRKTSKARNELKRLCRSVEKVYPDRVVYRIFENKDEIITLCTDAEEVARKSYQRGLGSGFVFNPTNLQRLTVSADKGFLRAFFIYIERKPVAFWIGHLLDQTFFLESTAYDPAFRKSEPGTVLFLKMLEYMCNNQIKQVDLGLGHAFYKERFGTDVWDEAPLLIFSNTWKGVFLGLSDTILKTITRFSQVLLERRNLTDKVKRQWRDRLLVSND